MTERQVVSAIAALIGMAATILTPIIKLNSSIVRLTHAVDDFERTARKLEEADDRMRSENRRAHKEFYDRLDGAEKCLGMYELRISKLEEHFDWGLHNMDK